MKLSDKIHVILYRIREKGLEIFLLSHEEGKSLRLPHGQINSDRQAMLFHEDEVIELEPVSKEDGDLEQAYAMEGDWHDIPSLKGMLKEDFHSLKDKIEEILPEVEKGTFVVVKDALKKVLPNQYAFLKELKDVITDRNSVKDI